MVPLGELTKESILDEKIFVEIFDQEDEIYKARLILSLEDRAAELGVKTKFESLLKVYKKVHQEARKKKEQSVGLIENWTNFSDCPYGRMQCRSWIASDDGICLYNPNTGMTDILACYHPIIPVERLKNLETGEEQIKLAYKRGKNWEELIVPKTMVTSASKIVALSGRGVSVTSENAKFLVRYLADVENSNGEYIKVQYSSSKLGWIQNSFIPYDDDIVFDGDARFRQIKESVGSSGSREKWYKHMKKLRDIGRIEVKFLLAASFASVLVHMVGGLPFMVDLWGETEGGKTVTLMVAASVWADPDENAYIKDYKGTEVGLEATCDFLNNLPLILDDSSKKNRRIEDNFEGLVYDLCSGKGKTRSNKELGLNRECHWKNCILTNGERPLNSYVTQGGAINRILELECGEKVYDDPQETAEIVKNNYGYAGYDFVKVLKSMNLEEIRQIQREFQERLYDTEKMEKQSLSLSIVLTADKVATDHLFNDGKYISIEEAKNVLVDREELSDNERCYQYILSEIEINAIKFDPMSQTAEKWGCMENGYVIIYNNVFDNICKKGGFSRTSFLSWADRKNLLQTSGGKKTRTKRIDGHVSRCVFLKLDGDIEEDKDGFIDADKYIDSFQEELPFK